MTSQTFWQILFLSTAVLALATGANAQNRSGTSIPLTRQLDQQPSSNLNRPSPSRQAKRIKKRQFDFLNDVELVGRNYAMSKPGKTVTYSACKNACLKSSSCKGFTHFSDGRCNLKESITTQRRAPGNRSALLSVLRFEADSGQIELDDRADKTTAPTRQAPPSQNLAEICGSGYYTYPSQDFRGFNLTLASNLVTLDGCRRLCNSNRRCKGFSWYGRPGSSRPAKCWMKRRLSKPVARSNRLACEKAS